MFAIDESNQVKISRVIMWCQGYFHKIALGMRLNISYYSIFTCFNFFFQSKRFLISPISLFLTSLFSFIRLKRFVIYLTVVSFISFFRLKRFLVSLIMLFSIFYLFQAFKFSSLYIVIFFLNKIYYTPWKSIWRYFL